MAFWGETELKITGEEAELQRLLTHKATKDSVRCHQGKVVWKSQAAIEAA
jgi:hypothetical protein